MAENIFTGKLCIFNGYLNHIKPIIINYLNIESLLEITSKNYPNKECIVTCYNKNFAQSFNPHCGGKIYVR